MASSPSLRRRCAAVVIGLSLSPAVAAAAQENDGKSADAEPVEFLTRHSIALADGELAYTARAGETLLRDDDGKPVASFFSISYTRDGTEDPDRRPIAFVFNGGPGSSSVWLHLGLVGPWRVVVPDDGLSATAPPYELEPNPATLLRVADLVFVDPIGTGYSRALGEKNDGDYWGVDEDADSVAEFVRAFITARGRWNSPKFLIGESYGTIRASLLADRLQGGLSSVFLNGIVLVSPAMDAGTLPFVTAGNDFPFIGHLPSFAATAWYHDALPDKPADLEAFLEEVAEFAEGEYLLALFKGDALGEPERERIVAKLQRYTGLGPAYIRQTRLRIGALRFTKELLRDRGQTIGLLDGRFLGEDPDDAGEFSSRDPSGIGISGAFVAGLNSYLARDLEVEMDREYVIMSYRANQTWRRGRNDQGFFQGFLYTTEHLARAASANRDLRFMVVSGYHDLTTAFFAARYMMRHSGIDPQRVAVKEYLGGHMMYLHRGSFEKLSADLARFVAAR